jgi:O-acetylserine/cysteine efflux transporter
MRSALPVFVALLLFLVWSNSFVAIGFLLGSDSAAARFDWTSLTVARFVTIFPICLVVCWRRRREVADLFQRHPLRLVVCALLAVPGYNFALYYGQQHGVPAPIASLTTTLVPLFVIGLAVLFLGETLTVWRAAAFALSFAGMLVIAFAKRGAGVPGGYGLSVAVTALAPLCWSLFTVLSKPIAGTVPPLLWTYAYIGLGTLPLLVMLPFTGGPELLALDGTGWAAVLFLSLACTALGFVLWGWLLRRLPASTVGLTVFLNPPLTSLSKFTLSLLFPATFLFRIGPLEWLGGAIVLGGLALALLGPRWAVEVQRRVRSTDDPSGVL